MPSPFPGMDPYLEGDLWQEFHETLAGAIRAQLMPQLTPRYVALLAKRYVIERAALGVFGAPPRIIYPDVHVALPPDTTATPAQSGRAAPTPPTLELASPMAVPQLSVEIRDVAERRLVTLIEILSPANKAGDGAREYAERRAELMRAQLHLLEVDLLRAGERISLAGPPPPAAYYTYLSRSERRPWTQVWAIDLRGRLPVAPVPLLAPDPDASLDLQAAVDACFELVGYERLLAYGSPLPPPPLDDGEAAWVTAKLQAADLNPSTGGGAAPGDL